ncbi:MAG: hypothetical protein R2852_03465 [Bacteroidia bacterium]
MRPILFLTILISIGFKSAVAQQAIFPMANGLPSIVHATCFDSLGNFYAVHMDTALTIAVKRWDEGKKTWSLYASLKGLLLDYINIQGSKTTMNFIW